MRMTVTPHFKKIDGFPCSLWNTVLDLGERSEACLDYYYDL